MMPYRRGNLVAVPYDYSDLTGGKVRPAVIVSSDAYNLARPDVIAAGISSQVAKAGPYDYILADWAAAGLRYPSLIRGRLLTIESERSSNRHCPLASTVTPLTEMRRYSCYNAQ